MDGEAMAEPPKTISELIWRLLKGLLKLSLGVLVLGALGVALWQGWEYYDKELPKSQIEISYQYQKDNPICKDKNYPLHIEVQNKSRRTIYKITFGVTASRPGHSTDFVEYLDRERLSDRIIEPGQTYAACWTLPKLKPADTDPTTLEWRVFLDYVRFSD